MLRRPIVGSQHRSFAANSRALDARDASQREAFYRVAVSALRKLARVQEAFATPGTKRFLLQMQTPSVVVFDLGKVLLDFDYGRVAAQMLRYCDLPREEILRALNQSPLLHRYETGLMTSNEFFDEVKTLSKFCGEFSHFEKIFGDIFTPIPQMIDLNTRLRNRGIPTYIFSNTNELAIKHIRATYPFFANFSGYIFSHEHRSMKPDAVIYQALERVSGKRGGDLLYIDDRPENVGQGKARGWQTIQHTNARETIATVEKLLAA